MRGNRRNTYLILSLSFSSLLLILNWINLLGVGERFDGSINAKREFVKGMMKDAWDDYARYAWGHNELRPVERMGSDGGIFGNAALGVTIIDSLSTLHIMGLRDEFQQGRDWVAANFDFKSVTRGVSVFETTIRILGGLLSAFALTKDELFKDKAEEVGRALLPIFDTASGIPRPGITPSTGMTSGDTNSLAELGTLHLEFVYLSNITGDPIFREKVKKIQSVMQALEKPDGLYFDRVHVQEGTFASRHVSLGGESDSFYEYLLKAWIQTGDSLAREMYDAAVNAIISNNLLMVSEPSHLLFITEREGGVVRKVGTHLQCFAGGMLALGAATSPKGKNRERDFEIGANFTNTCHETYIRSRTHLGPEIFRFSNTQEAKGDSWNNGYLLRPEVIESYFYMFRLSRNELYQLWAWDAAQAIERYTKVGKGRGYSAITSVDSMFPIKSDVQPSFFLAETLKYLYLIFSPRDLISLDAWVFNTEAHPFPIL